jgi:aspartyl-tRNA(Asn)/glutamyl-tRNA(Gln) amidotransferase subunit C
MRPTEPGVKRVSLSREDVRKVALLARLELEEEEIDRQAVHINRLLEQFEKLQELDVTGVEPTSHSIPLYNVFREDISLPSLPREEALANAPESRDGCIVVPRILEG